MFFVECDSRHYGTACANVCMCNATNTKTCDNVDGSCECKPGFQGTLCEDNVNECLNTTLCPDVLKTCVNTHGSFYCGCIDGYTIDEFGACIGMFSFHFLS